MSILYICSSVEVFFLGDLAQAFDIVQKFMSSHIYVVTSLPNWSPYVDTLLSECPLGGTAIYDNLLNKALDF